MNNKINTESKRLQAINKMSPYWYKEIKREKELFSIGFQLISVKEMTEIENYEAPNPTVLTVEGKTTNGC